MWEQPVDGSPLKPKTRMSALGWRRLHHCERTPGSMLSRGWNKLVKLTSGKLPRGVCVCARVIWWLVGSAMSWAGSGAYLWFI